MRKYEKYKDSGVKWIGKVPEHWKTISIKNTTKCKDGLFIDGDWIESPIITTEGIRYITTGNIGVLKYKEQGNGFISEDTFIKLNCTEVFPGDLIISRLNEPVGRCCIIPDLGYRIITAVDNVIFRPDNNRYNKTFLMYQMNCSKYSFYTSLISRGATMQRISRSMLGNIKILVPSLPEQQSIASYLDSKVGEIDNMIEKTEKKIELYEELKKSIITHAVTKGLNPNAKMKDSGVDWIGEIPENWEAMKVAWIYKLIGSGTTPKTDREDYYCENGENWLQTGDLNDGIIIDTSKQITKECITELNLKIYPIDSLVIAMYGATIGKIGLLDIETTTNQACCVLAKSKIILPKFSYFVFLAAKQSLILKSSGGGQPNISQDKIRTHYLPIPSIKEQNIIVSYLDSKTNAIDSQISIAHKRIDLLKELKSSLITNVVTGKIKVAPLSDKEYKTQMGD